MADTTYFPDATGSVMSAAPRAVPPRRRRPGVIALAAALIAAGALSADWLYTSVGHTYEVLAVARDVPVGGTVSADDLTAVRITLDPGIQPVSNRQLVVGKRAAVGLKKGTLITLGELTDGPVIGADQVEIGIATSTAQRPAAALTAGRKVLLIGIPSANGGPTLGDPVPATVVSEGAPDSQQTVVVDVAVPVSQAAQVEVVAGQGKVGIVLGGGS